MGNLKEVLVDFIKAKIAGAGVRIRFGNIGRYKTAYGNLDFQDDDIPNWRAVKAVSGGALSASNPISVPSGSPIPFVVDMTGPLYVDIPPTMTPIIEQFVSGNFGTATRCYPIYDVKAVKVYTSTARGALSQLLVYGHPDPDDLTQTIDELQIVFK